jgi:hypothetical protein
MSACITNYARRWLRLTMEVLGYVKEREAMAFHVGMVTYSAHGHRQRSEGTADGQVVVMIHKNKNHTHSNNGIYTVVVNGVELTTRYREIDDARRAGSSAYAAQLARS